MSLNWCSIKTMQLETICRTCMNGENQLIPIETIHEEENKSFAEILMVCTSIQINSNDGLPKMICELCKDQLILSFNFKIQSEQIDATLRAVSVAAHDDIGANVEEIEVEEEEIEETLLITKIIDKDLKRNKTREIKNCLEIINDTEQTIVNLDEDSLSEDIVTEEEYLALEAKENQTIVCDRCSKVFIKLKTYETHRARYCLESYECKDCFQSFELKHEYDRHRKLHRRKQLKCEYCGKIFHSPHGYAYHIRIHENKKEFVCTYENCTKRFALKQSLEKHMSVHSGGVDLCYLCGKMFTSWDSLHYHLKTHNGERPYQCTECGKSFKQMCHLKSHEWLHSGEKPYECEVCKKAYTSGYHLKKHQKRYCLKST